MGVTFPFRAPGNYSQVMRAIRRLWDRGTVEYRVHAVRALLQSGLTDQDVESIILTGSIIEHGKPRGDWRWKIQGGCVDGHTASCVVQIEIEGSLLIVTVIDEAPEGGTNEEVRRLRNGDDLSPDNP